MSDIQEYITYFFNEYVYGFMYNDVNNSIKLAKANFLVALGLSTYTEIMGGLVTGNLWERGHTKSNYQAFLPYLGQSYVDLERDHNLYDNVRCGLVHEFFIKKKAMIAVKFDNEELPGIIYTSKYDHFTFAVENYFKDFKKGVEKYHGELKSGNSELIQKFKRSVMEKPHIFNT